MRPTRRSRQPNRDRYIAVAACRASAEVRRQRAQRDGFLPEPSDTHVADRQRQDAVETRHRVFAQRDRRRYIRAAGPQRAPPLGHTALKSQQTTQTDNNTQAARDRVALKLECTGQ